MLRSVWPLPFSLATTHGISFDVSSSGYLDVSVPRVPRVDLWIQSTLHDSSSWGFPHSDIHGSMLIYNSPWLFAVSRVLRRLLMPRHSPYALLRLNNRSFSFELHEFHFYRFRFSLVKRHFRAFFAFSSTSKDLSFFSEIVVFTLWKDLKLDLTILSNVLLSVR